MKEIEPPRVIISTLDGNPLITDTFLMEVFAYRGVGKSALLAALIGLAKNGGRLLDFKSDGGFRVLHVDGELPERDIQKRMRTFTKPGQTQNGDYQLRYLGMNNGKVNVKLNTEELRSRFIEDLAALKTHGSTPDVIALDTRVGLLGYDTNDAEANIVINDFLSTLRGMGFSVWLTNYAGKNGKQRGRSDNDDALDLSINLSKKPGWSHDGTLKFAVAYEKVRQAMPTPLKGFNAMFREELSYGSILKTSWIKFNDDEREVAAKEEALEMLKDGKSPVTIANIYNGKDGAAKLSRYAVEQIKKEAMQRGEILPEPKKGRRKADA